MKAISIRQPWASLIATGRKTIETRKWRTEYRGDILIVSSARPRIDDLPAGKAICICKIANCRAMTIEDEAAACCKIYDGTYSWILTDIRKIKPFNVRGKLRFFEVEFDER
jgi:hypothetical protein